MSIIGVVLLHEASFLLLTWIFICIEGVMISFNVTSPSQFQKFGCTEIVFVLGNWPVILIQTVKVRVATAPMVRVVVLNPKIRSIKNNLIDMVTFLAIHVLVYSVHEI